MKVFDRKLNKIEIIRPGLCKTCKKSGKCKDETIETAGCSEYKEAK